VYRRTEKIRQVLYSPLALQYLMPHGEVKTYPYGNRQAAIHKTPNRQ